MTGELGSRECLGCDPGKISVSGGNCTDCGRGSYANSGKTACVLCEKGTWSSALGANDITTCRNCSLGRYSSATGVSEESGCNACARGKFSNISGSPAQSFCLPCGVGTFSGPNASKCHSCPVGYSQIGKGQASCLPCLPGEFGKAAGAKHCDKCHPGKTSGPGATNCPDCEMGKYQPEQGQASCLPCVPGRFTEKTGCEDCALCDAGQFQDLAGNTTCRHLPPGLCHRQQGLGIGVLLRHPLRASTQTRCLELMFSANPGTNAREASPGRSRANLGASRRALARLRASNVSQACTRRARRRPRASSARLGGTRTTPAETRA